VRYGVGVQPYTANWAETGRKCTKCGRFLPWDAFMVRANGRNGRMSICRTCHSVVRRAARLARIEAVRAAGREYERRSRRHIRRTYGLTPERYDAMVEAQAGRCGVCGREPKKRLVVDHCHRGGQVRALLCDNCNVAMGLTGDNPALLRKLADYIDSWSS
jgi:hypothetical protein